MDAWVRPSFHKAGAFGTGGVEGDQLFLLHPIGVAVYRDCESKALVAGEDPAEGGTIVGHLCTRHVANYGVWSVYSRVTRKIDEQNSIASLLGILSSGKYGSMIATPPEL